MQEELIAQHLSVVQLYIVTERQTLFVSLSITVANPANAEELKL